MMEHVKFAAKVALVILAINQVPAIADIVKKNYFA